MANGELPALYSVYKRLAQLGGLTTFLTPRAFELVGPLRAFETLRPTQPQAVVPQLRQSFRRTGGVSGLF